MLAGAGETPFGRLLHPPIDRILLQQLAADPVDPATHRVAWRGIRWTQLNADDYFQLIHELREGGLDQPAFWAIERYWAASR